MKRNGFSLSNYHLLTANIGYLYPVNWEEILPGDIVEGYSEALIRSAPLNAPPMHPVFVRFHHFYVRNRLLWDDAGGAETGFDAFITGGSDGTKTPTHPYLSLNSTNVTQGSLFDYLDVPVMDFTGTGINISALPFRAYDLIYNEYFRDQDLCAELTIDTSDGLDNTTSNSLKKVCWPKDSINIARSSDSLGDNVTIPLLGSAPIKYDAAFNGTDYEDEYYVAYRSGSAYNHGEGSVADTLDGGIADGSQSNLKADLTSASGVDIGDLLLSFGLQSFQESRNKYGHRYTDYQRFIGVRPSETLAYMPEYLGGGKQTLNFSEVLSTDGSNTGQMKGHGITALRTNRFRRAFNEHGILMTMMSVVPKTIYADQLQRKFNRTTKEEYFTRELQFIGDEIIPNKEVYAAHSTPEGTFGYGPRYESYRTGTYSRVSGEFQPGESQDHWHFALAFGSDPSLNQTFVECTPPTDPFQSGSTDQLYCMVNNSVKVFRGISQEGRTKIVF